ncbi:MAG: 23S rRNA (cytosine1962-C5)-methyltransferase [Oleiphilaceae bacterium]|jgi:23S rRNA (cytosine1962-C5)-methyltransferase
MKYVQLNKGAERRLKQGHLWIYSNEIDVKKTPIKSFEPGEQVQVKSNSDKLLGTAFMSPASLITGRMISRDPKQLMDQSLITHRLNVALSLRKNVFSESSYRLVFGDSDRLPGLVIDRFEDVYVVQISSVGMEALKADIVAALDKVLKPKSIIFKNNGKMRGSEELESYVEVAKGDDIKDAEFTENGVKFIAPIIEGQKTGWFFDHRMNRARLKDYVKGKRVLDLYSYVGGWGVQAAAFGASSVTCVDSSTLALDYVIKNAELNNLQDKVECIEGDVFDVCKKLKEMDERFDIVIADPPAFIPRRKDQKAGELAYQRLNQLAMRLLSKDGLLISASCSMHLSKDALVKAVSLAGQTLEKQLQIIEQGGQGPDHPILPSIPETDYLKAIFVRVLPA